MAPPLYKPMILAYFVIKKPMVQSAKAQAVYSAVCQEDVKLGDLRKMAKEIKRDHEMALELWQTGDYMARQLAILIMDRKALTPAVVDQLSDDISQHPYVEMNQLADWFMANQLTKGKPTIALMESWQHSNRAIQRRIYWYYQGRLRWAGKTPPNNAPTLLAGIEAGIATECPEVQWAMNFTAAQIGINEPQYRAQCIALGERLGLYKDEPVSKGCTPAYLPAWINQEVAKLQKV